MKREEHIEKITQIKEKVHEMDTDGSITQILADLSTDYGALLTQIDEIKLQNESLEKNNATLRDANLNLFLKVNDQPNTAPKTEDQSGTDEPKKYENLFDEKGELK